jgi:4-hydroxy-2-oxoglutarate aldolase
MTEFLGRVQKGKNGMTRKEVIQNLRGIFPPVVTPFNRRGEIEEGLFRENLQKLVGIGLSGVLVAGSTGEGPYLEERERLRLVEVARGLVRPPEILIAGTGLESTDATVRLSQEAVARGADALLVLTPNYYKSKMDADTLAAHYRAVARQVERPVIVYSIPQFTGLHLEPATIAKLSRIPNVVGLKESSGDIRFVRAVLRRVRPGFHVLVGSVLILNKALRAGAVGAVLGQADFAPELCVGLYQAFLKGKIKRAREFQERLLPLARKIALPFGVPGIKAALDLSGYAGGFPRAPLAPLGPAARESVAEALREARAGLEC